jgi:hypothetical protein
MGDILLLRELGRALDLATERDGAAQVRDLLAEGLLKVRNKKRELVRLRANRAQREYARNCSKRTLC